MARKLNRELSLQKGCVKHWKVKSGFAVELIVDFGECLIQQECIESVPVSSAVIDFKGRYSSGQTEEKNSKEGRKVAEHATPKYASLA